MSTTPGGSEVRPRAEHALGVFFVALSTLMLEITLTRLFSVTIWYHFGALAVSLAMFGVGASGVAVYVLPDIFRRERLERQLPILCALFAVSIAASLFLMLGIVFIPRFSLAAVGTLTLLYLVTVVPFFLSGLCIALVFAHRPHQIGRLYFMDLLGAGLGCIVAVGAMFALSAPDVVLLAAVLAGVGSVCFATAGGGLRGPVVVLAALIGLLLVDLRTHVFRIDFIKGLPARALDFERWTPYAYVGVGEVQRDRRPFAWGLSPAWNGPGPPERTLKIDEGAATTITDYGGDLSNVEYLRYDVTSIGHNIFDRHKVLIIGAGGGRDILAALAFGADAVHALEYNAAVVEAVNEAFGDFSGRVYDLPKVRPIVEEGRSYIQRTSETYDFIQASLVDSWAANASGAYVMAENFLYTKEAFAAFLDRLTERGVLSVSRFNLPQTPQVTRTVSLAMAVLAERGVTRPGDHMLVVTAEGGKVGTLLVAKRPFAEEDVRTLVREAERLQFDLEWAPGAGGEGEVAALLAAPDPGRFLAEHPFDLSPPTDDRPFFFHMANSPRAWRHVAAAIEQRGRPAGPFNLKWYGTFVLIAVLVIATALALLCILTPLYTFKRADLSGVRGKGAFLGYFTCLGIGFMLVEIPLMQRFTLFLGHPVYSLSVVLFALLVWAGFGSLLSSRLRAAAPEVYLRRALLLLACVLALYNFLVPALLNRFIVQGAPVRIALAAVALIPLGLVLGMPLPLGMRVVERHAVRLVPWMWGINGASSVLASLLALATAMTVGLTATMLGGQAIYLIALLLALTFGPARAAAASASPGAAP